MSPQNAMYIPSDDEGSIASAPDKPRYAVATRAAKRARADTDGSSSPLPDELRISSRAETPFDSDPPTPRDPTPTPSELGMPYAASETGSTTTDNTTQHNRNKTKLNRLGAQDQSAELQACIQRIKASKSDIYKNYEDPVIIPKGDMPPTHYGFACKLCARLVPRRIGVAETSNLKAHLSNCPVAQKQAQLVGDFGFTGSSVRMSAEEVREHCALWMAENARPFNAINDRHFRMILHPDARKHLPHRDTISKDIKRIYEATQQEMTETLANIRGVFHIALDLFQSGNGFDFLGLVIFHPDVPTGGSIVVKRFVLECLNFAGAHTGVALAKTVHAVLCKFKIQDRVWGVVCDNASNNAAMMSRLSRYGLARLDGPLSRVHCMLHVINLVARGIGQPFRTTRQQLATANEDESDDEGDLLKDFALDDSEDVDMDPHDDGTADSGMLCDEEDEGDIDDFAIPEIEGGSPEEAELLQITKVLWKVAKFAYKIRYSPAAKAAYKGACVELQVPTPHNVRRDVKTRWNSTDLMLEDAERTFDAIVTFQQSGQFIPRTQRLRVEDRKAIRGLLYVLKPLRMVTEILSRAGVPMLADVIVHYDTLNFEYSRICVDQSQPIYIRQAANRARLILNKYYQKTDESELYRLAMLLHPSMRVHYLKQAGWEDEWIDTAVEMAVECWTKHYKVNEPATDEIDMQPASQFGYSSFMDKMYASVSLGHKSPCPITDFVNAAPVLDRTKNGKPLLYNPLVWWHGQRAVGNEWDGLTQMALDVLSCPATSVDVERAFSFAGSIVSKRRHNLKAYTIQATATLGSYSKAGLVKWGILTLPRKTKAKAVAAGNGAATASGPGKS